MQHAAWTQRGRCNVDVATCKERCYKERAKTLQRPRVSWFLSVHHTPCNATMQQSETRIAHRRRICDRAALHHEHAIVHVNHSTALHTSEAHRRVGIPVRRTTAPSTSEPNKLRRPQASTDSEEGLDIATDSNVALPFAMCSTPPPPPILCCTRVRRIAARACNREHNESSTRHNASCNAPRCALHRFECSFRATF
jgi:hypothetical protein